ncbi:MAG: putative NADPH-dependent reductase [Clostridia bacterium]|nr:putative NADPH-dependent reductase [Clostridia bacterium]
MKITIINGNSRHGSTWHCRDLFLQEFARYGKVETKEFTLPKDMPHFCNGCFSCFFNGEDTCPHASSVTPIVEAMLDADLIILTSSVYAFDVTGQMKALLDHLCFMWASHRPNPIMFNKVGLTITTTAGAGLGHTTKTMKNSLTFWGIKRIFTFKNAVSAMKWADISEKKSIELKKQTAKMAKRIYNTVNNINKLPAPFFFKFFFGLMKGMMKNNTWNPRDKNHWESQGWLSGSKPF